MYVIIMNHVTM